MASWYKMRPGGTDVKFPPGRLRLDLRQYFVAGRQQGVNVILDGAGGDSAHAPGSIDIALCWQVLSPLRQRYARRHFYDLHARQ
jgi:hypothetical protein